MSKRWAKEDRVVWDRSEVFKEFEKSISLNIVRLSSIQDRLNIVKESQSSIGVAVEKVKELGNELKKVQDTAKQIGLADDSEVDDRQVDNLMFHQDNPYSNDGKDWEEDDATDHIINDLKQMASDAINDGNIKLAYKIERTIQEILDKE
jgi:hypothetical protein